MLLSAWPLARLLLLAESEVFTRSIILSMTPKHINIRAIVPSQIIVVAQSGKELSTSLLLNRKTALNTVSIQEVADAMKATHAARITEAILNLPAGELNSVSNTLLNISYGVKLLPMLLNFGCSLP